MNLTASCEEVRIERIVSKLDECVVLSVLSVFLFPAVTVYSTEGQGTD